MELKLFWTDFSQKELEKIYEYYHEKENRIEINDVFDTRQNPIKIERTE